MLYGLAKIHRAVINNYNNSLVIINMYQSKINNEIDCSDDEIKIEHSKNGNIYIQSYPVPYRYNFNNRKRLICFSAINNQECSYGNTCTYAHSLSEQIIDDERKFIYEIILDDDLSKYFSISNPKTDEIYKNLLFATQLCENCLIKKCTGGYNCRNGVCTPILKLCRNDLLTGQCLNKIVDIEVNSEIKSKIFPTDKQLSTKYIGCINGHHLSHRNLLPYYKYVHSRENYKKNRYRSIRYIDMNPLNKLFRDQYHDESWNENRSDESTDDEVGSWFKKDNDSDDDIFQK